MGSATASPPSNRAQHKGNSVMKYRRHESDRKPIDKRTRRQMDKTGKRSFLHSCTN
jgi:hypothetical protein